VPSIGYGSFPLFKQWRGAIGFMLHPVAYMKEGYAKHKDSYFKISTLQDEYVIVSDKEKIAEYLAAPDHVLNFQDGANDAVQIPWTMGYGVAHRTYHVPAVRITLTQHIAANIAGMLEQIHEGMDTLIGKPADWVEVPIYDVIVKIVAKVSNRAFSGTLLCQNEQHLNNAIAYAQDVFLSSEIIRAFPNWLKPFLIMLTPIYRRRRLAIKLMGSIVQERLDTDYEAQGKKKPDDMIQWLVDSAPPIERTMPQIVERIMALNVASIHTTTMTLTSALYILGAEWEKYTPILRAEVRQHCEGGEITKQTLGKLVKLDSFLRESGRFNNTGLVSLNRNARKEFRFKDGTVIPAGARVGAPSLAIHNDPQYYLEPEKFDGFRFSRMREESAKPMKHQMVSTDIDYLPFGHGKHACPGRFFAVNEMKLIFANLLLRYDLKLIPGTAPARMFIGTMAIPETKLKVLMRSIPIQKSHAAAEA
ncbi:cytochrome P450, partial [Zopfia rhizophila CBS 207.26]